MNSKTNNSEKDSKRFFAIRYERGIKNPGRVYNYGDIRYSGSEYSIKEYMKYMREYYANEWAKTKTKKTVDQYVNHKMGELYAVSAEGRTYSWLV